MAVEPDSLTAGSRPPADPAAAWAPESRLELAVVVRTPDGRTHDLVIEAAAAAPVHAVAAELAAYLHEDGATGAGEALTCLRTGRRLPAEEPLAAAGLLCGDELLLGDTAGPAPSAAGERLYLAVVGGPAAGTRVVLPDGESAIGRDAVSDIALDDPSLSSRHVLIRVEDGAATVADAGSRNGTSIDGALLAEGDEHPLEPGTLVRAGRTLLALERAADPPRLDGGAGGRLAHNRPPRITRTFEPVAIRIAAPPAPPQRGRIPLIASIVPVVLGVVLWLIVHSVAMLAFTALTPVMAIATYAEDRRTGKRGFARQAEEFRARLLAARAELDEARAGEVQARRDASPSLPDVLDRIRRTSPSLWERRPGDDDFLSLRLGSCDQPSQVQVVLEPGGTDELRDEAEQLADRYATAPEVPFALPLREAGAAALVGRPAAVAGVVRSLLLQIAGLHSPADVAIAAAVPSEDAAAWEFLKWLPHTSSEPALERQLALGRPDAHELLGAVAALEEERLQERDGSSRAVRRPPWLVLVLDERVSPERALVSRLLERCADASIAVVWLGADTRDVPGECSAIGELDPELARLSYTDARAGRRVEDVTVDSLDAALALASARLLAPVEDASARGGAVQLPQRVGLLELLDLDRADAATLVRSWESARDLAAPLGSVGDAPYVFDLRNDGPHALVAGMTGAGKSELLQSMIASFAATHPPDQVSFLLVDYKGGAAFKECDRLPHTVGFVTDLDEHLTRRALVSLDAELHRRERVLDAAGAKDLLELRRRDPHAAPPALVIVIDEFATLVKEVPDFVQGVVDVAQRGRSLGVHLILATQRPAGVVSENVRANTNLRLALRVASSADSAEVIGVADAASIPRSRPGRAYARTGEGELTAFQTAYVGAPAGSGDAVAAVAVRPFALAGAPGVAAVAAIGAVAATELESIVEAARGAVELLGLPPLPKPWLSPLAPVVPLAALEQPESPTAAALALVDDPARQEQRPFAVDLAECGGVLVYGAGGSGKTTVLRTLAVALAERSSPADLHVYGLDFASRGLAPLETLPHCGSVVPGDDGERIERTFALVRRTIDQRRETFAAAGAFTLADHLAAHPGETVPRLLVLLDGYAAFVAAYDRVNYGALVEELPRLISDGRTVGVHFAISAERRGGIPNSLTSAAQARIVLRMPTDDDLAALGFDLRAVRGVALPPGRGFVESTLEAQFAVPGEDAGAEAQRAALAALAERWAAETPGAHAPEIGRLPATVSRTSAGALAEPLRPVLGLAYSTLEPFTVDLRETHFLVAGPYRSGRSTALRTIAASLRDADPSVELHLLAPRRSPLPDEPLWTSVASGVEACVARAAELAAEPPGAGRVVVVVDDGEGLSDTPASAALEAIVRQGRDSGVRVVAAFEREGARAFSGWARELRKDEHGLLLQPDDADAGTLNTPLPRRSSTPFPPGRGYVVRRGAVELVQVAAD